MSAKTVRSIFLLSLIVASMIAASLVATASASADIRIVSHSQHRSPDEVHIAGEVINEGSSNADFIEVTARLLSSSNQQVGTESSYTLLDILAPGEKSPFHLVFAPPTNYHHYPLSVTATDTAEAPNHNFTVRVTNTSTDADGDRHINGEVTNNNETRAEAVQVVFTFYNAEGGVVEAEVAFPETLDFEPALDPGETAPFELILTSEARSYATFAAVAESSSPPTGSTSPNQTTSPSNPQEETHARTLTLALRRHVVAKGQVSVTDGFTACASEVEVVLQRRTSRGWRRVAAIPTTAEGTYRTKVRDRQGRYRAIAPAFDADSGEATHTCARAVSVTRLHRH